MSDAMRLTTQVIAWHGDAVANRLSEQLMDDLAKEAENVLADAMDQVPLDTGQLMRSGRVERDDRHNQVLIRFTTEYAAKQHEEPNYQHAPGRKWKYLEDPLRAATPRLFGARTRMFLGR